MHILSAIPSEWSAYLFGAAILYQGICGVGEENGKLNSAEQINYDILENMEIQPTIGGNCENTKGNGHGIRCSL